MSNMTGLNSMILVMKIIIESTLKTMAIYICRGSISRIEDKQRTVTDIELYGLAKVLGVSIEDLFEEKEASIELP